MRVQKTRNFAEWLSQNIVRITGLVFLLAIIAVGVASIKAISEDSSRITSESLKSTKLNIEKVLSSVETGFNAIDWVVVAARDNAAGLSRLVSSMLDADSSVVACCVAFEPGEGPGAADYFIAAAYRDKTTGVIDAKNLTDGDYAYQFLEWYQIPKLTGSPYWNDPTYSDFNANQMITSYSVPLFDEAGKFIGALRADVTLDWLAAEVSKYAPFESGAMVIVARNGSYITHPNPEMILTQTIFTDVIVEGNQKTIEQRKEIVKGQSGRTVFNQKGHTLYAFYEPLRNGWSMVSLSSIWDFIKPATRINFILLIIAALGLLTLYLASRKVITRLTKPITEFSYAVATMSRGNFNATLPTVSSNDEIKQLETSMRYMQNTITRYIKELKETTSKQERIESELNIASGIQLAMLPPGALSADDFDIYAIMSPAKEVGGDLYYSDHDDDYIYFAVGDVSGKGVPAALFMAITTSSFRFVGGDNTDVADSVYRINNAFAAGNQNNMFVTLFVARINRKTLEMEYCNGGHNPIVIVSPDGEAKYLHAKANLAVGLFEEFPYQGERLTLQKGSRIIAYTDGVSEAEDYSKDLYGEDRLLAYANSLNVDQSSQSVVEGLFADVKAFTKGNEQNDDITILSVKL